MNDDRASRERGNPRERILVGSLVVLIGMALLARAVSAHPGSAIVVDEKGQIFFTDTGHCVWKIDSEGKLTRFHNKGAHWMALDRMGRFPRPDLDKWFAKRITPWLYKVPLEDSDRGSALILADGCPLAVHGDGDLYYANRNLEITRLSPDGKLTPLASNLSETTEKLRGVKGLASGPDGSLYAACPSAVLKIAMDGKVTTIVHPIALKDCDKNLPQDIPEPYLRGLAVDSRGTVYAAAAGCRRVLKIAPGGNVEVVLKSEPPWSPNGVAVHRDAVYVLENTNPNAAAGADEWVPRVRKLEPDGKVTTLATVSREERKPPAK